MIELNRAFMLEFWTLISLKMIPDVIMRECFVIKRLEKC